MFSESKFLRRSGHDDVSVEWRLKKKELRKDMAGNYTAHTKLWSRVLGLDFVVLRQLFLAHRGRRQREERMICAKEWLLSFTLSISRSSCSNEIHHLQEEIARQELTSGTGNKEGI